MSEITSVGISDMKIIRSQGTLITYALGSCVGLCLYDPMIRLAGMVHVLLPKAPGPGQNPCKYADTGFHELLRKMEVFGASKQRLIAKMAGGAKMFDIPNENNFGNIGANNIEAMRTLLRQANIPLRGQDVGSNVARTLSIDAADGKVNVKILGKDPIIL